MFLLFGFVVNLPVDFSPFKFLSSLSKKFIGLVIFLNVFFIKK